MMRLNWEKLGLLFNPNNFPDRPEWMHEFAQAPCTLEFDDFLRVYFSTRPKPDLNGQYVSYCAFVDLDPTNLFKILNISSKPILELGKTGAFDEFGTYPVSVLREKNKILAFYGGWTRLESVPFNVAIGYAESYDGGITFNKIGDGPVLSYSLDEPFVLSGPKIRKFNSIYYLFYIAGQKWIVDNNRAEPIYKIRLAISQDGLNWTKLNKDLIISKYEDEAQASPDVIFLNGKYHMFFCYRKSKDYRKNKKNTYRIGYAYSYDLINWFRDDEYCGFDVSEFGFDNEMVAYPHVFKLRNKIYMMYLGNEVGRNGFGLALLRGDL